MATTGLPSCAETLVIIHCCLLFNTAVKFRCKERCWSHLPLFSLRKMWLWPFLLMAKRNITLLSKSMLLYGSGFYTTPDNRLHHIHNSLLFPQVVTPCPVLTSSYNNDDNVSYLLWLFFIPITERIIILSASTCKHSKVM